MKRLSAINPGQDQRGKDQGGERVGTEANPPNTPVAIATPMVQNDKGGIALSPIGPCVKLSQLRITSITISPTPSVAMVT